MNECEPLRKKIHELKPGEKIFSGVYVFDKDDVASAVRFYKKWKHKPMEFNKKYPDEKNKSPSKRFYSKYGKFEDWLFDYCFGDVIE